MILRNRSTPSSFSFLAASRHSGANARITLTPRPKQKDSAEVYIGEEFIGVVFEDEDEDGSFMFEMAILAEDLP